MADVFRRGRGGPRILDPGVARVQGMTICPACGFEASEGFAYCPGCGTRLRNASLPSEEAGPATIETRYARRLVLSEERKVVTILFCDLVGFTALSEANDHENVDAMLRTYAACARGIIEAHGGVVEKFIGDAAVGIFGVPRAHDDDPERAVRAGLRIATEVPGLVWPGDTPLAVRVGVNTGETFLHTGIDPASGEAILTGDAVNTAARLQSSAPPGGLVVGELTHRLIAKAFVTRPLEPLALKGKADPVQAWLVGGPVAHSGLRTTGESTTPFVGRQRELAALQNALGAASEAGAAQFVLLVGEPGIGKSRLVLEFAKRLEEGPDPVTWRQGRCLAYGDEVGFSALSDVLKAHAGVLDSDETAIVEAKLESALPEGEDRPWLLQRLRPLLGLEASEATPAENYAVWTRLLESIASGPAVLVFEDVHWANEEMRTFVRSLPRRQLDAPLLIIATARPELLEQHPDLLEAWSPSSCVVLQSLERDSATCLAAEVLGGELTDETADSIMARTGGNPLYVEEYGRLLGERELLRYAADGIEIVDAVDTPSLPDSLQGVIAARLDLLSPLPRATLADAAVLGESFWQGGVAALGGLSQPQAVNAMRELEVKHLVRPAARSSFEGETEYVFWHALVRDVVYARLPRKVRVAKHAAAAKWVERAAGERTRELAEVLAYHYATAFDLASSLRDPAGADLQDAARHYLALAGERTEPLDADAAERYYSRAIAMTPESVTERYRLLARRAVIALMRGRPSEAAGDLETAAAGLLKAGDTRAAAVALSDLSDALATLGDEQYREVFAKAVDLISADAPSPAMVDVLLDQAAQVLEDEGPRKGLQGVERVIDIAESIGMPVPIDALDLRGRARCTLGDAGGLDDLRRAIEAAEHEGRRVDQAGLLVELAWCLASFEGPEASLRALDDAGELFRRSHMEGQVAGTRGMAVRSLYWAGEWDVALSECEETASVMEETGDAWGLAIVRYVWSLLLLGRGDAAGAEQLATQALEAARGNPIRGVTAVYLVATAAARHGIGDDEAAFALLGECRDLLREKGDTIFVYLLPLAVRTAAAAGDAPLARSLAGVVVSVLPFGEHVDVTLRAQVGELYGDVEEAAAAYAAAASRWHDFGIPYEEGYALLGRGRCLAALHRAHEAAPVLEKARAIFARLQARPALDEVDAVLTPLSPAS